MLVVAQRSHFAAERGTPYLLLLLPSPRVPPTGVDMACSLTALPSSAGDTSVVDFIDIKTCIDRVLALLGEMRAVTKKMAVAETKRRTLPDVRLRSDGGSHTWEWSSTCRAPTAASVIALVAALHGGSHDLSLRASGWGPPFRNKNSSFGYP
jgi:hypothetical protein